MEKEGPERGISGNALVWTPFRKCKKKKKKSGVRRRRRGPSAQERVRETEREKDGKVWWQHICLRISHHMDKSIITEDIAV